MTAMRSCAPTKPSRGTAESADLTLRRAYLLRRRGDGARALRMLDVLLADDPHNTDALDMKREIEQGLLQDGAERREAARQRATAYATACRVVAFLLAVGALLLFSQFIGSRYRVVSAGPVVLGLHGAYWYLLGAIALAVAALAVWMLRYRWEPEWTDLDRPDPEWRGSGHWLHWLDWWWWWW
jgi:hypothetical protein